MSRPDERDQGGDAQARPSRDREVPVGNPSPSAAGTSLLHKATVQALSDAAANAAKAHAEGRRLHEATTEAGVAKIYRAAGLDPAIALKHMEASRQSHQETT
ncbi:MAG: hypothetical protein AAF657_21310 [Acidobacteriota bacterium]